MVTGDRFVLPPGKYRTVGKQAEIIATAASGIYYASVDDLIQTANLAHGCAHFLPFGLMSDGLRSTLDVQGFLSAQRIKRGD